MIEVFTDGACRGNPGPGGWGALLRYQSKCREISGATKETTNNRMELTAAIEALKAIKHNRLPVQITTDSKYVKDGVTQWLEGWKARGWKTAQKKPVKNVDLWKQLDTLVSMHNIEWYWVKGHSGHIENDRADALANEAIDAMLSTSSQQVSQS